jgi:RHS repeat-associated protein
VDAVLARETSGGTVAWYLPDRLGTIRDIVDNTGAVIDHVDYGVFGNPVAESSSSNGDRFKFAGLENDAVTGLNFALHRTEDAVPGRWLSEDPLGLIAGDRNTYRYVLNNSTTEIDPLGLQNFMPGWNPYAPSRPQGSAPQIRPMTPSEQKRVQDLLDLLRRAINELGGNCPNGKFKPLDHLYIPTVVRNKPGFDAFTLFPPPDPNHYKKWPSGPRSPYPNRNENGPADHGFDDRGPFPTYLTEDFFKQGPARNALTLLHESFHGWGYYADPKYYDYADDWAGQWFICITTTKTWQDSVNPQPILK